MIVQVMADLIDQYLRIGDLVGFIIAVYTSLIGQVFYGLILLIITVPLYIRTQSIMYCSILWIVINSILVVMVPTPGFNLAYVLLAAGIAGILFELFRAVKG